MNEPAMDLGIVMAILSSYRDKPIDEKTIVFGEVGLSGEVRAVSQAASASRKPKNWASTQLSCQRSASAAWEK